MNVRELKEALQGIPDHAEVYCWAESGGWDGDEFFSFEAEAKLIDVEKINDNGTVCRLTVHEDIFQTFPID